MLSLSLQRLQILERDNNEVFSLQIYDAGDFSRLTVCSSTEDMTYTGGSFLSNETVIVWGHTGVGHIYKLPPK